MQRRSVASPAILPISHSSPSRPHKNGSIFSPRRKRQRPYKNTTPWELNRTTVRVLAALGLTAFLGVHFILYRTATASQRNSYSPERQSHHNNNTATTTIPNDDDITITPIHLTPLRPADYQHYTIRINTWKRLETLKASLQHHLTCEGVAQIQVVWCTDQGPVPEWLFELDGPDSRKVVVEEHAINSLNERFAVQTTPPTLGILSLDDDLLRPCLAYDVAFWTWTQHSHRMVGFDARSIVVVTENNNNRNNTTWKYAYQSTTEKTNRYALTLTRCSFVHVDYLRYYSTDPYLQPLRTVVDDKFECEDIALSLTVSRLSDAQPPLLAPYWAVSSMIKLDQGGDKISATANHKRVRDDCVNDFAELLLLKEPPYELQPAVLRHDSYHEYGVMVRVVNDNNESAVEIPDYLRQSLATAQRWKQDDAVMRQELADLRVDASEAAYRAGLVFKTTPWKERFGGTQKHRNKK